MNRVIEVSLDDLGRILIPAELRGRLGRSPGMTLIVEEGEKDGVRLRLQSEPPELVDKGGVLVVRAEPVSDLANFTRRERDHRVLDLLQRPRKPPLKGIQPRSGAETIEDAQQEIEALRANQECFIE